MAGPKGSQKLAVLLCKFKDTADVEPQPRSFFENLFANVGTGGLGVALLLWGKFKPQGDVLPRRNGLGRSDDLQLERRFGRIDRCHGRYTEHRCDGKHQRYLHGIPPRATSSAA